MSLLVFGSTALDSIATPKKNNPRLLGGSGSHAAVAASFFAAPKLIGVVGTDLPRKYISLLKKHKVNLKGLKVREGKTFHWAGEYEVNMNNRRTLSIRQIFPPMVVIRLSNEFEQSITQICPSDMLPRYQRRQFAASAQCSLGMS